MGDEIDKLEELFANGFILEPEYNERKKDLKTLQRNASFVDVSSPAQVYDLADLVARIKAKTSVEEVLSAVRSLRKMIIEQISMIDSVVQSNVIPDLLLFLSNSTGVPEGLINESLWVLANIASGKPQHVKELIKSGAIQWIVFYLDHTNNEIVEQSVWAIGNIAGDGPKARDTLLQVQGLSNKLVQTCRTKFMKTITWTACNLCRGKPPPKFEKVKELAHIFASNIDCPDQEIMNDALLGLSYLTNGTDRNINYIVNTYPDILPALAKLIQRDDLPIMVPAIRVCGNIATSSDEIITEKLINTGFLLSMSKMIAHSRAGVRKEACWTISNITADSKDHIQAVINANLIEPLINLIKNGEKRVDVQTEAIFALGNAMSGANTAQLQYLLSSGVLQTFIQYIQVPANSDSRGTEVVMEVFIALLNCYQKTDQHVAIRKELKNISSIISSLPGQKPQIVLNRLLD